MKRIISTLTAAFVIFSSMPPVFAVTGADTWVGNVSSNLGDANWTGSTNNPPITGDSWQFGIAATSGPSAGATSLSNTLPALQNVAGITFASNAPAYTFNGNSITLTGGISNNSNNNQTFGIGLAGNLNNAGTGSGELIISSDLTNTLASVTQSSSTSTLVLSGNNSYTGSTILSAGTLQLASANAIGSVGEISFNGGTLQYTASNTTDYSSRFNTAGGQAYSIDTNGQNVTLASNLISAGGSMTKMGSGTLTLTGNNTFSGETTLDAGVLNLGSANAIADTSLIEFSGGTLQYSASNTTDYSSIFSTDDDQAYNIDTNGQNITFATGLVSAGGTLTKLGSGILTLSVDNDYTGTTSINGGVLQISDTGDLGDGSATNTISMQNGTLESTSGTNDLGTNRTVTLNSGSGTFQVDAGQMIIDGGVTGTGNLILNNDSSTNGGITVSTGAINNVGAVTNSGTGTGTTIISAAIGSNVAGVTQNSSTSTLVLSNSSNSYNGPTTISLGTLQAAAADIIPNSSALTVAGGAAFDMGGFSQSVGSLSGAGSVTSSTAGAVVLTAGTDNTSTSFSGAIGNGSGTVGLTKTGTGTLTLSGANSYTGPTAISNGTLKAGNTNVISSASDVSVGSGSTFDMAGFSQTVGSIAGAGTINSSSAGSVVLTAGDASNTTFSGTIENTGGTVGLTKTGSGSLTLSGNNSYSGQTTINAGTLTVANANAVGTGALVNNATLNLGSTNLTLGAAYTQNSGATLDLTANSFNNGKITTSTPSTINSTGTINVSVNGYIPMNETLTIIDTQGTGLSGAAVPNADVTSDSPFVNFSDSIVNGDELVLTAMHTDTGFASIANNDNARRVGNVLDYMTNPTTDFINVLSGIESQSNNSIQSALNTMGPVVDGGIRDNTRATMNNFISTSLDRLQTIDDALDRVEKGLNLHPEQYDSGTSTKGSLETANGIWAKPYGSYLMQGAHQDIDGYKAWNAGTVIGYDHEIMDHLTLGLSGGWAYGGVNSDLDSNSVTDFTSTQASIYGGYQDPDLHYYINGTGSFAWNKYRGQRGIDLGADDDRKADSNYNGQQFDTYLEGGYKFKWMNTVTFTPLTSLQWDHETFDKYNESAAGALDLNVDKQSYDLLETGIGASLSAETFQYWGVLTPEVHAKWLYDYINDRMAINASFSGGGGAFSSYGIYPPKDGLDVGGKLIFDFINNISLITSLDAVIKQKYFNVLASGTINYKF